MAEFTFENGNQIYQRTRLQIGPLYLSAQSYKAESIKYSKEYVSANPMTSLSFTADEIFPEEYITEANELAPKNFIKYHLMVNENEYAITPGNRGGSDPSLYYINSDIGEAGRKDLEESGGVGFIDSVTPITVWKIKATIKRPSNMPESTPIITGYRFTYTYE